MTALRRLLTLLADLSDRYRMWERKYVATPVPLPARMWLEQTAEVYPCCGCCSAYAPQPCPVIHRTPCDKDECAQAWRAM